MIDFYDKINAKILRLFEIYYYDMVITFPDGAVKMELRIFEELET